MQGKPHCCDHCFVRSELGESEICPLLCAFILNWKHFKFLLRKSVELLYRKWGMFFFNEGGGDQVGIETCASVWGNREKHAPRGEGAFFLSYVFTSSSAGRRLCGKAFFLFHPAEYFTC